MTDLSVQAIAEQPGSTPQQEPVAPGVSPATTNVPGLPPTGQSQQLAGLNEQYQQTYGAVLGGDRTTGGPLMLNAVGGPADTGGGLGSGEFGRTSLQDMAETMAKGYGLNFGRGSLIDAAGNFLSTPDQLAARQAGAGGEGMGLADTAASMNYIAQAINDRQVQQQQDKATAALQAGVGLVQSRGRGSLAALQSGFYQSMAANYTNPNLLPEQQDFSYWIQKEGMLEAMADRDDERTGTGIFAGGAAGSSGPLVNQPTFDNPLGSTDTGPQGSGDVVTSGPHAGEKPVYTYDPISKTTTVSWEKV